MLDDSEGFSAIIDRIFCAASEWCYGQSNDQKNQEFVTSPYWNFDRGTGL